MYINMRSINDLDVYINKCEDFDKFNVEKKTFFSLNWPRQTECFTTLLKNHLMLQETITRKRNFVESEIQKTVYNAEAKRDQLLVKPLKEHVDGDELF